MIDYLNVPLSVYYYALRNHKTKAVAIWLYLKFHIRGGHFKLTKQLNFQILFFFGIKSKITLRRHLKWLLRKRYITYNSNTDNYRLSGLYRIGSKYGSKKKTGAILYLEDLVNFKEFAFAVCCKDLIRRCRRTAKRAGLIVSEASLCRKVAGTVYHPLANALLSEALGLSISTISNIKLSAQRREYIFVKKSFSFLFEDPAHAPLYRKYGDSLAHRVKVVKQKVYIQEPDQIGSYVILRKIRQPKNLL